MKKLIAIFISIMFLVSCATPSMVSISDLKCPIPPELPKAAPAPIIVAPAPAPVIPPIVPIVEKKIDVLPWYFGFDKSNLENQNDAIDRATAIMKADKTKKAELQGNCDARGSDKHNMVLGQRRADTVKSILIKNGIDEKRLSTKSFGKTKATIPAKATDKERAKDRRVDIVVK